MNIVETLSGDHKWRLPRLDGFIQWILPAAILLVWQVACSTGYVPARVLPAPTDVALAGWKSLQSGELGRNIWVSFWRATIGFLIGGGIGFAFGFANGLSQLSDKVTDTTLQMIRNVPHLALIPLVILWFGIDESAKLFLVALGVFFPVYLNTLHGIRTVDPHLIEMGRIYGISSGELFRRVIFPGALPSIFVGVRFALGIMWLTLIVAETIAASSGLGYMAMQAREFMLIDVVVLSILIYALLGKLADSASRFLEQLTLSWHPAETLRVTMQPSLRVLPFDVDSVPPAKLIEQARIARRASEPKFEPKPELRPGGLSLTIRGLRKSFGENDVLRGIDLHIPAGQFVAIVGRSGCGKSTLLRLIAGLETATSGTISFGEETRAEDVRVMFQEPRLLPWATVAANVEVGLGRDRAAHDAKVRAEQALTEVGLRDKRGQWPNVLSGGQKQRVALARALVSHPRVLAFDEPLGALDALTRISMQRLFERVWDDQAFTAILVTHDVSEAVALADRVLVIEQGRIAHDVKIDIARPRRRGSADLAALEGSILQELLKEDRSVDA